MFSKKRYCELASWVFDNFGKVIAQNTVEDIVLREEFWLATSDDAVTLHKVLTAQYPQLEDALYLWFSQQRTRDPYMYHGMSAMICSL